MADFAPSNFLNPLGPIEWAADVVRKAAVAEASGAEAAIAALKSSTGSIVGRMERDAAKGARVIGQSVATASQPAADAAAVVGDGLSKIGAGLFYMGDQAKEASKKVLLGEMAVVAVSLLGIGVAVWFSTQKKPAATE